MMNSILNKISLIYSMNSIYSLSSKTTFCILLTKEREEIFKFLQLKEIHYAGILKVILGVTEGTNEISETDDKIYGLFSSKLYLLKFDDEF